MASSLGAIEDLSDQKVKIEQYKQRLDDIFARRDTAEATAFVDHMLSEAVGLVVSRQLLQKFAQELPALPADFQKPVAKHALERMAPRVASYEEQATAIREQLAALLEAEEDWTAAAQTLAGIDLDSGMRVLGAEYKLRQNVRIAMLFLEDDDSVNAELYIKKASALLPSCKDEALELQYRTSYARILDAKRRFLDAAQRYYELSQIGDRAINGLQVGEESLQQALSAAVTCCILAAAGPQRSRVLANLYKDERSAALPSYSFLEKVFFERILRPEEVAAFSGSLRPHQRAITGDGSTVLERAVAEHNLLAASRLYDNVYFSELGPLLGLPPAKAERTAARMIAEQRLAGSIDQVEGLLRFDAGGRQLQQWDAAIQALCGRLNDAVEAWEQQQQPAAA